MSKSRNYLLGEIFFTKNLSSRNFPGNIHSLEPRISLIIQPASDKNKIIHGAKSLISRKRSFFFLFLTERIIISRAKKKETKARFINRVNLTVVNSSHSLFSIKSGHFISTADCYYFSIVMCAEDRLIAKLCNVITKFSFRIPDYQ